MAKIEPTKPDRPKQTIPPIEIPGESPGERFENLARKLFQAPRPEVPEKSKPAKKIATTPERV